MIRRTPLLVELRAAALGADYLADLRIHQLGKEAGTDAHPAHHTPLLDGALSAQ